MKKLWVLAVLIFILAVVAGSFLLHRSDSKAGAGEANASIDSIISKISTDASAKNYVAVGSDVNDALSRKLSNADRMTVLETAGDAYLDEPDYNRALSYYLQVIKAGKADQKLYDATAQAYVGLGDKTNAITYYQRAEKAINPNNPTGQADAKYYQQQIAELKK